MQVPIFSAKDLDSDQIVSGFYVEYPVTNVQVSEIVPTNIAHCIFTYKPGMMGVVNEPYVCTIDLATLKFEKFVEVSCSTGTIII